MNDFIKFTNPDDTVFYRRVSDIRSFGNHFLDGSIGVVFYTPSDSNIANQTPYKIKESIEQIIERINTAYG